MWAKDEKLQQLAKKAWNEPVEGTPMYCFVRKFKVVKRELKVLHKNEYSKMQSRILVVKKKLDNVQLQMQNDSGNHELWVQEKE